jgi:heavy metal translocating P-type ATPase
MPEDLRERAHASHPRDPQRPPIAWHDAYRPLAALLALAFGGMLYAWRESVGTTFWLAALFVTGAPVAWRTLVGMWHGRFAADVVAMLAIVSALILRQPIAGLVIVLMQSGGELLERYAEGRASEAVRALELAAPHIAHRVDPTGTVLDVTAEDVVPGDVLLVRPGEMLPCDGVVTEGSSHLDEARITGEPLPRAVTAGAVVQSGAVNGERALHVRATAAAGESLYARIVELVRVAQAEKSPIQRVADRYAVWFTPLTLVVSGAAWAVSGDPVRALAVLVVATPCPLILATPVAIIGGINRAARRQIIVRTGAALEQVGSVNAVVFDKTGTLTLGHPEVDRVTALAPFGTDTVLRLAASVEQQSGHLLARTTVAAATARGMTLDRARDVVESPGRGVTGTTEGRSVTIGSRSYVEELHPGAAPQLVEGIDGTARLRALVTIDGVAAGTVEYADRLRDGLPAFLRRLASLGVARTLLLSGDHRENVFAIARTLGIADARGDIRPEQKVDAVRELLRQGYRVLMVGDGTNDAPALSAATVGVALAAHGGGITAEAADIVLLADDVSRVAEAIEIGRRATRIARESILVGLGLSGVAMVVAALGYLAPTIGALLQEAIDVAVILNALRASQPARTRPRLEVASRN